MTIVDNATLDWAKLSHPDPLVREVASIMLDAGPDPVDQAERLVAFVTDERQQIELGVRAANREAMEATSAYEALEYRIRQFARKHENIANDLKDLL